MVVGEEAGRHGSVGWLEREYRHYSHQAEDEENAEGRCFPLIVNSDNLVIQV